MKHSAELGLATVFDVTIAKKNGFLYTIYGLVEDQATLYVGQTRGLQGHSVGLPNIYPMEIIILIFNVFPILTTTRKYH